MNKKDTIKTSIYDVNLFYAYLQNWESCLEKYDINLLNHKITRH